MHNSKLYSILKNFSQIELNRLRKYLLSPYFNKNEAITGLFEAVIRLIKSENGVEFNKEKTWEKLYPGKKYDDVRFRKLNSDLLKLVESFLAQQIYEENPLHQATYLVEAVGRKKMGKLYNSTMRTARRLSEQQTRKPADYYFYQYKIESYYYDIAGFEMKRGSRINVEEMATNLDRFYLSEKLKFYVMVLSHRQINTQEYNLLFMDEIIHHIENHNYDEIPHISVYYQILRMLTELENKEHYFKLKELLTKHGAQFPQDEAVEIYGSALNYCIGRVNIGNRDFLVEIFYMYEEVLKNETIFVEGELSPWDFKNIVITALRLNKFDWTKEFINNFQTKVPALFRENAVNFNMARLNFYKGAYDEVISLLQFVEYDDVFYGLDSKTLLLQSYYELDEIEPLYSLMDSFRAYLNRNKKIPTSRKQNYLRLIKFLKKLTKTLPSSEKELAKLSEEINATSGIASGSWLKQKVEELQ